MFFLLWSHWNLIRSREGLGGDLLTWQMWTFDTARPPAYNEGKSRPEIMMFGLAAAMVLALSDPGQVLAGPAFERFAAQTELSCPARHLRLITPGDLSWEEEGFEDQLSVHQKARLNLANRADKQCAERDGLSCPTTATLQALMRTNMLRRFSAYACSHPQS